MIKLARTTIVVLLFFEVIVASASVKKILVVNSYHPSFQWDQDYSRAIHDTFKDSKKYQLKHYYMDTKRIPKSEYQQSANRAIKVYEEYRPNIVILGDDNALKYVGPILEKRGTPFVYLGINNTPRAYLNMFDHSSGVLERPILKRNIYLLKKILLPQPKKVLLLFDDGNTSQVLLNYFSGNITKVNGVEVHIKLIKFIETWYQTVLTSKAKGYDAVFIGLYQTLVNKAGEHVKADDIIHWTSKHSPLPLFAFWSFAVGKDKAIWGACIKWL
ncbi:sugar ABC transporter [Piscirickettsia litoralis]|uniref:sugar ABC transporter n=1 Tax=Piscirickettsia litoralis TaxID=1891921 RepID=UPI001112D26D|nr:sugar ABC transporter [Piscirickettsia litoralis]